MSEINEKFKKLNDEFDSYSEEDKVKNLANFIDNISDEEIDEIKNIFEKESDFFEKYKKYFQLAEDFTE